MRARKEEMRALRVDAHDAERLVVSLRAFGRRDLFIPHLVQRLVVSHHCIDTAMKTGIDGIDLNAQAVGRYQKQ
jgi:hypothetical protein